MTSGWTTTGKASGGSPDPEVEVLVDDIARTRREMSRTADEIGNRLTPANLVQEAKETVREATVGKVEQMADNANDAMNQVGSTAREAGSGMFQTIRENPIPAALLGIGAGWLWMSRNRGSSGIRQYRYPYGQPAGYGQNRGQAWPSGGAGASSGSIGDQVGGRMESIGRDAGSAMEQAGQTAGRALGDVRQTAEQIPDEIGTRARDVSWEAQRLIDQNPLAVGAIALAVGTAVGMSLPATRTERRILGDKPAQLIEQATSAAEKPLAEAEDSMREMERQATD
jgi:ElaB/YqjD/DUF883 family membrane-anchored ribosome-binding protein